MWQKEKGGQAQVCPDTSAPSPMLGRWAKLVGGGLAWIRFIQTTSDITDRPGGKFMAIEFFTATKTFMCYLP